MILADAKELPLAVSTASANPHESSCVRELLGFMFSPGLRERAIGDKAYDSGALGEKLALQGMQMVSPTEPARQVLLGMNAGARNSRRARRVSLRKARKADLEDLRRWRNRHRNMFFDTAKISADAQKRWYGRHCKRKNDFLFMVCHRRLPIRCTGIRMTGAGWDLYNVIRGRSPRTRAAGMLGIHASAASRDLVDLWRCASRLAGGAQRSATIPCTSISSTVKLRAASPTAKNSTKRPCRCPCLPDSRMPISDE